MTVHIYIVRMDNNGPKYKCRSQITSPTLPVDQNLDHKSLACDVITYLKYGNRRPVRVTACATQCAPSSKA
eukprot:COSAG02_NODE_67858_length_252_cov_0.607843_1_plen_70_part_10